MRPYVFDIDGEPPPSIPDYSPADIERDIRTRRTWVTQNFEKKATTGYANAPPDDPSRVTRSSMDDDDNWILDEAAYTMETTERRRLSRVPLEHVAIAAVKTKFLLLVRADSDDKLLKGKAFRVHEFQANPVTRICGRDFYTLQCAISQSNFRDLLLTGVDDGLYTQKRFVSDYKNGQGGFQLSFPGTQMFHALTWKELQANPLSLRFFAAPMSHPRAFDEIFRNCTNKNKLHHRYLKIYDEFEGDKTACIALENSYLHANRKATIKAAKRAEEKDRVYDVGLFKSTRVVDFVTRFDEMILSSMQSVFLEFKNHSHPIISEDDMQSFIDQAPEIFGDYWLLECDLRGIKFKQAAEQDKIAGKVASVFFAILTNIRLANRRRLRTWALIQNIADYARGVKSGAEKAASYFGTKVHPSTRVRIVARMTGNDPQGRADCDTLEHKQRRLLKGCVAVALCYDNFQRGVSLKNQRGEHSSAFFKGTHQCAHNIVEFDDDTFDGIYPEFTQIDQAIPSPWGMPAFETFDDSGIAVHGI